MKRYWKYFKTVCKHKMYVIRGGWLINPWNLHLLYRNIVHDLSKFLPSEFGPYARTFYAPDGSSQYDETLEFNMAWNHHQKRNKHHWQYWQLKMDRGDLELMPMPRIYVLEMLSDWIGAGWCYSGDKYNTISFYLKNDTGRHLHPLTRKQVEEHFEHLALMKAMGK